MLQYRDKISGLKKGASILVILLLFLSSLQAAVDYNSTILEALASMPRGGGYSTKSRAMERLQRSITLFQGKLKVHPATPSFCSEAVYLVFLKTLLLLEERGELSLDEATQAALLPRCQPYKKGVCQPDGTGIWGRWNANGPGVAALFYETGIGKNFTSLGAAQPGDFLKIFWSSSVGATEHGHLVIYLGHDKRNGMETIRFWSSNQKIGYSTKSVPLCTIKHLLFSRLTDPSRLASISPHSDLYLASLLKRTTSWREVKRRSGVID
jgi:hypothetical protein